MLQLSATSDSCAEREATPELGPEPPHPFLVELAAEITRVKAGEPLRPVTVVVPSSIAHLHLRRRLVTLTGQGLANVRFMVLSRIAELLGSPSLARRGLIPLSPPLSCYAVTTTLRTGGGRMSEFAEVPSAAAALARTFADIRHASAESLAMLRDAELQAQFTAWRARLESVAYDELDVFQAATEAARAESGALADIGHLILVNPEPPNASERALLDAFHTQHALSVVALLCGEAEADAGIRWYREWLGSECRCVPARVAPCETECWIVPDAEDELRAIATEIHRLAGEGVPLYRIAILGPDSPALLGLAGEVLKAAGIPFNDRGRLTLADTRTGRFIRGALRLRSGEYRRDALLNWLGSTGVQAADGPIPVAAWERISRAANVVRRLDRWQRGLERLASQQEERLRAAADEAGDGDGGRGDATESVKDTAGFLATEARRMRTFLEQLDQDLAKQPHPGTWEGQCTWLRTLAQRYLKGTTDDPALTAIDELRTLARVAGEADPATFAAAVEAALTGSLPAVHKYGHGVFVGRVRDADALEFDLVFLVGMSEGAYPPRPSDDPVLPQRIRDLLGPDLPPSGRTAARLRRDYLLARAAAPRVIFSFTRADRRQGRALLPSRWFLDEVSRQEGKAVSTEEVSCLGPRPWLRLHLSFPASLAMREPTSPQEYRLRLLLGRPRSALTSLVSDPAFVRGVDVQQARLAEALSPWDGRVTAGVKLDVTEPLSPTALEQYGACPFRFFLKRILRVDPTEKPEEVAAITPRDRGDVVHRIVSRFLTENPPATADYAWTQDDHDRLRVLATEELTAVEQQGLVGETLLWQHERKQILESLGRFLERDANYRASRGCVPVALERKLEAAILLGDETVRVQGKVDRIDATAETLYVWDYKTGKRDAYSNIRSDDPTAAGLHLQLPLYAWLAERSGVKDPNRDSSSSSDNPVAASDSASPVQCAKPVSSVGYWFLKEEQEQKDRIELEFSGETAERCRRVLAVIVAGIKSGVFPAVPGDPRKQDEDNCRNCDYHKLCPVDRATRYAGKSDPLLVPYQRLRAGEVTS